jgi:hypothetical protein
MINIPESDDKSAGDFVRLTGTIPALEQFQVISKTVDVASVQAGIGPALRVLSTMDDLMPKVDMSHILRAQEIVHASALPQLDWLEGFSNNLATQILPAITLPQVNWLGDFHKNFASQMVPMIAVPRFELPTGFLDALRMIDWDLLSRRSLAPSNWPDEYEEYLPGLLNLVNIEGVPAAWVPRQSLLLLLVAASSAEERTELLIAHREEILEDCVDWVETLEGEFITPQLPIAKKVLAACKDGHWEVAAISAVAVVHAVVESLHWVSDRQGASKHHRLTMELPVSRLLEQATRAPLAVFYDEWNPRSGKPRPAQLSRHVVSHRIAEDQVSNRNCIVAVMLMASLLVSVEQLELGRQETTA